MWRDYNQNFVWSSGMMLRDVAVVYEPNVIDTLPEDEHYGCPIIQVGIQRSVGHTFNVKWALWEGRQWPHAIQFHAVKNTWFCLDRYPTYNDPSLAKRYKRHPWTRTQDVIEDLLRQATVQLLNLF